MKKNTFVALTLSLFVIAAGTALAAQRVVVAEDITGTWCQYCPAAANGFDQLYNEVGDSLLVIALHGGDVYQTTETINRINAYNITGYPTVFFDGTDPVIGSDSSGAGSNSYHYFRPVFDAHKTVASPFEIAIHFAALDLSARTGQVEVKVRNTSASADSGILQFVVVERAIPVAWQGMTQVDFVARDFMPDENGEAFAIGAGDSATFVRSLAIPAGWVMANCRYAAFIQRQNGSIAQGAQAYTPCLTQTRVSLCDHAGNPANYFQAGDSGRITVWLKDKWKGGSGAGAFIVPGDTFITIGNGRFDIGAMAAGDSADNSGAPFTFTVNANAATAAGHQVALAIVKKVYDDALSDSIATVDTVKFWVGALAGFFSEDFESGMARWTLGGTGDTTVHWDTTGMDYHSPGHCLTDSKAGNYPNSSNRYCAMATGVDLRPYATATISWWERYQTESPYDLCKPQCSANGGTSWGTLTTQYSGTSPGWARRTADLTSYCGTASAFKVRFLLSSNATVNDDGWYIDDVTMCGFLSATGVAGRPTAAAPAVAGLGRCRPNPVSAGTDIEYALGAPAHARIAVYDISGRLVRTLVNGTIAAGAHSVRWDGRNDRGISVANGIYLYRLETGQYRSTGKLTVVR